MTTPADKAALGTTADGQCRAEAIERLGATEGRYRDPYRVFNGADDALWLWANTVGVREMPALRDLLPGLPSVDTQLRWTGKEGDETLDEGHRLAVAFKSQYERFVGPLGAQTSVLDFGCGWGRILRFLLRDVAAENLTGIDADPGLVDFCRESLPTCSFFRNDAFPPTSLPRESFDLSYAYSLFTHFSEDMHLQWLQELRDLLVPGGVLIATVRPRGFIPYTARLSEQPKDGQHQSQWSLSSIFGDTDEALRRYDAGEFVYVPYPSSRYGEWWGEACISAEYIRRRWSQIFEVLDIIEDSARFKQHLVVLRRIPN